MALPFAILDDEMTALRRFHETCEDSQPYDVPKEMMRRLAEIGLVRRVTAAIYEFTNFGLSVLIGDFAAPVAAQAVALKDHQIAALVNELRDIAVQYGPTQQLRERIAHVIRPLFAQGAMTQARMLTSDEADAVTEMVSHNTYEDYANVQRKFCAVNGVTLAEPAKGTT